MVAGQAGTALHTMAVLQACRGDLLKDQDQGQGLPPKVVAELRLITDFALRATKPSKSSLFGTSIEALVRKVQYNIFNTFILFLYPLIVSVLLD